MNGKYYILTLGCQMNKNDSERIKTILNNMDFFEVKNYKQADIYIINTCSVRKAAEDRVFGIIKNLREMKKENKDFLVDDNSGKTLQERIELAINLNIGNLKKEYENDDTSLNRKKELEVINYKENNKKAIINTTLKSAKAGNAAMKKLGFGEDNIEDFLNLAPWAKKNSQ